MLVLSRKATKKVIITTASGEQIVVCLLDVRGYKARIGFEAAGTVSIHRQEVYDAILKQRKIA